MINKIGVGNFRVFKEYTEFEIRPITLLTGPNNAGKSSFTKLLLLLKNGMHNLDFTEGLHNLESFEKVLNWNQKEDILKLSIENKSPILGTDFNVGIYYKESQINRITFFNNETVLFDFSNRKKEYKGLGIIAQNSFYDTQVVSFDINYFINLIYSKNINLECLKKREKKFIFEKIPLSRMAIDPSSPFFDVTFDSSDSYRKKYSKKERFDRPFEAYLLNSEIDKINKDYLIYEVYIDNKPIADSHKGNILNLQQKLFSNLLFNFIDPYESEQNNFALIESVFGSLNQEIKTQMLSHYKKEFNTDNVQVVETALGELIFIKKIFCKDEMTSALPDETLIDQLKYFMSNSENIFKDINYLSANRGSQKRILTNKSENDIDEIVVTFFRKKDKNIVYLNQVLEILEISGELIVERFENVISVVYLKTGDKKIALSDLGYGYSQIIPIILKLINMISYNQEINFPSEGTIIIEEPEANLHPNLQSKLADVFVTTLKFYPDLKFIIETHSEYFIRKLQYLTAKKEISVDSSVIYYFNVDKHVTNKEPKVKKIEIRENGNLSDTFGPGFYDETTRLQFDLMKLNQEQNN
jgi:predicted ATPase